MGPRDFTTTRRRSQEDSSVRTTAGGTLGSDAGGEVKEGMWLFCLAPSAVSREVLAWTFTNEHRSLSAACAGRSVGSRSGCRIVLHFTSSLQETEWRRTWE